MQRVAEAFTKTVGGVRSGSCRLQLPSGNAVRKRERAAGSQAWSPEGRGGGAPPFQRMSPSKRVAGVQSTATCLLTLAWGIKTIGGAWHSGWDRTAAAVVGGRERVRPGPRKGRGPQSPPPPLQCIHNLTRPNNERPLFHRGAPPPPPFLRKQFRVSGA